MYYRFATLSCLLLALAVVLGAFGAHGLEGVLTDRQMSIYEKASFYHFVNSLGLLIISSVAASGMQQSSRYFKTGCQLLTFGIVVFSGSLYTLAITDLKWLGAVTPLGGMAFIIGWAVLAAGFLKQVKSDP